MRAATPTKLFILGLGCQKGGTTWLYSQLSQHPQVDLGFMKEYHVFDALSLEQCSVFRQRKLIQLEQQQQNAERTVDSNLILHLEFYKDTANYFDYFDRLHREKGVIAVGDITPAYCALPVEMFTHINEELLHRKFEPRLIFLMRDPIDRIWSQLRMHRRNMLRKNANHIFSETEEEELLSAFSTPQFEVRTRYETTIANIEAVFNPEQIFYGFYETLFTKTTLESLGQFLAIDLPCSCLDRRMNPSPKTGETISQTTWQTIAEHYRNTYRFCEERFETQNIWKGYQYL